MSKTSDLEGWFYTLKPEYKDCSRKDVSAYVKHYPRTLSKDGFMDNISYYDFSIAPMWPFGLLVAQDDMNGYCRICTNVDAVVASKIPGHWAEYDDKSGEWVKTLNGRRI